MIQAIVITFVSFQLLSVDAKKAACSCGDDQRTEDACKVAGGRIVVDSEWGFGGRPEAVCIFHYEPNRNGDNGFGKGCGQMSCAAQVNDPKCA